MRARSTALLPLGAHGALARELAGGARQLALVQSLHTAVSVAFHVARFRSVARAQRMHAHKTR